MLNGDNWVNDGWKPLKRTNAFFATLLGASNCSSKNLNMILSPGGICSSRGTSLWSVDSGERGICKLHDSLSICGLSAGACEIGSPSKASEGEEASQLEPPRAARQTTSATIPSIASRVGFDTHTDKICVAQNGQSQNLHNKTPLASEVDVEGIHPTHQRMDSKNLIEYFLCELYKKRFIESCRRGESVEEYNVFPQNLSHFLRKVNLRFIALLMKNDHILLDPNLHKMNEERFGCLRSSISSRHRREREWIAPLISYISCPWQLRLPFASQCDTEVHPKSTRRSYFEGLKLLPDKMKKKHESNKSHNISTVTRGVALPQTPSMLSESLTMSRPLGQSVAAERLESFIATELMKKTSTPVKAPDDIATKARVTIGPEQRNLVLNGHQELQAYPKHGLECRFDGPCDRSVTSSGSLQNQTGSNDKSRRRYSEEVSLQRVCNKLGDQPIITRLPRTITSSSQRPKSINKQNSWLTAINDSSRLPGREAAERSANTFAVLGWLLACNILKLDEKDKVSDKTCSILEGTQTLDKVGLLRICISAGRSAADLYTVMLNEGGDKGKNKRHMDIMIRFYLGTLWARHFSSETDLFGLTKIKISKALLSLLPEVELSSGMFERLRDFCQQAPDFTKACLQWHRRTAEKMEFTISRHRLQTISKVEWLKTKRDHARRLLKKIRTAENIARLIDSFIDTPHSLNDVIRVKALNANFIPMKTHLALHNDQSFEDVIETCVRKDIDRDATSRQLDHESTMTHSSPTAQNLVQEWTSYVDFGRSLALGPGHKSLNSFTAKLKAFFSSKKMIDANSLKALLSEDITLYRAMAVVCGFLDVTWDCHLSFTNLTNPYNRAVEGCEKFYLPLQGQSNQFIKRTSPLVIEAYHSIHREAADFLLNARKRNDLESKSNKMTVSELAAYLQPLTKIIQFFELMNSNSVTKKTRSIVNKRFKAGVDRTDTPNQFFDDVLHLNMVNRVVEETKSRSLSAKQWHQLDLIRHMFELLVDCLIKRFQKTCLPLEANREMLERNIEKIGLNVFYKACAEFIDLQVPWHEQWSVILSNLSNAFKNLAEEACEQTDNDWTCFKLTEKVTEISMLCASYSSHILEMVIEEMNLLDRSAKDPQLRTEKKPFHLLLDQALMIDARIVGGCRLHLATRRQEIATQANFNSQLLQ